MNTNTKSKKKAFAQKFQASKNKKSTRVGSTASKRNSTAKRGKSQQKR